MKKQYETPKAEKYVFNYLENVVASNGKKPKHSEPDGKNNANACYTHNGANVNDGCGVDETGAIPKD